MKYVAGICFMLGICFGVLAFSWIAWQIFTADMPVVVPLLFMGGIFLIAAAVFDQF